MHRQDWRESKRLRGVEFYSKNYVGTCGAYGFREEMTGGGEERGGDCAGLSAQMPRRGAHRNESAQCADSACTAGRESMGTHARGSGVSIECEFRSLHLNRRRARASARHRRGRAGTACTRIDPTTECGGGVRERGDDESEGGEIRRWWMGWDSTPTPTHNMRTAGCESGLDLDGLCVRAACVRTRACGRTKGEGRVGEGRDGMGAGVACAWVRRRRRETKGREMGLAYTAAPRGSGSRQVPNVAVEWT
ncbi:hypothetical protein B0H16DRAFT_1478109 [Mycena metata]|uniref:Uncharacterized protein n=1 Tax=Mycena metata TaxID=1033252 RepID=A0AAD7H844_9AGAR|nr:hypothetical protein B0H16DRAFT_1478109 [Mycena metata]